MKNTFKKIIAVISSAAVLMANTATFSVSAEDSEYGSVTITVYDAETGELCTREVEFDIIGSSRYGGVGAFLLGSWSTLEQNPFVMTGINPDINQVYGFNYCVCDDNPDGDTSYSYVMDREKSQVWFDFASGLEQNVEIYMKKYYYDEEPNDTNDDTITEDTVSTPLYMGDANCDGRINAMDATLIARYSAGSVSLSDEILAFCDVNSDGRVNAMDATQVARGMISH